MSRKNLAEVTLFLWLGNIEKTLVRNGSKNFSVSDELTIADLELNQLIDLIGAGFIDGVPKTITESYVNIVKVMGNVRKNEKI